MASKEMAYFNVGNDEFEIVDEAGRQATAEVDEKVDDLTADNIPYSEGVSTKQKIDDVKDSIVSNGKIAGANILPQTNLTANTAYLTHKLTIPETGVYMLVGAVQAINGQISLNIRKGETSSSESLCSNWKGYSRNLVTVIQLEKDAVITLWLSAETAQTYYVDGRAQFLQAVRMS